MKPSFFTLFKRGKYFHPLRPGYEAQAGEQPAETVGREVREIERFTAAAIGFCFKHDQEFRRHFLTAVCAAGDSRELVLDVEPFDWADLLIEYPAKAYVVELKVSAPLKAHQDPSRPAWSDGYGKLLTEHFRGQKIVEYIILSGSQPSGQARSGHRDGVSWRRKYWFDLAKSFPVTELARDLANSLEVLGVPPLLIERTSEMKALERISAFGEAAQVLYDTVAKLGLDQKHCHLSVKFDPKQGTAHLGIDVRKADTTENHRLLSEQVAPPLEWCVWYGYVKDGAKGFDLGVWFYSGRRDVGNALADKLRKALEERNYRVVGPEVDNKVKDTEWWNVVVRACTHSEASDRDWFTTVFEVIGIRLVM